MRTPATNRNPIPAGAMQHQNDETEWIDSSLPSISQTLASTTAVAIKATPSQRSRFGSFGAVIRIEGVYRDPSSRITGECGRQEPVPSAETLSRVVLSSALRPDDASFGRCVATERFDSTHLEVLRRTVRTAEPATEPGAE